MCPLFVLHVDMVHVCGVLDCPIVDKHTLYTLSLLSVHYCEMEGVFKDSLFRSILFDVDLSRSQSSILSIVQ